MEDLNNVNVNSEEKIIRMPTLDYVPEPGGMGKFFFSRMSNYGKAIAQVDGLTGEEDTYEALLKRCIRTAITMRTKGITSEDIITICSFNHLNSCVPFIAGLFLGVKMASLDPTISLNDTIHLLMQIKPTLIFVGHEAVDLIENALRATGTRAKIVVFQHSEKHMEFAEFLQASSEEEAFKPIEVEDLMETAAICFSSGTTGLAKGICLNHYSLLCQSYLIRSQDCQNDMVLAFSSMYWISATLMIMICVHVKGCRVVVPKFDPETAWNVIANLKVTTMFLASCQAIALCKKGRPKGITTSHLSKLLTGGGPITHDQIQEFRTILPGTKVILGYGQTEVTGWCAFFLAHKDEEMKLMERKLGSSGIPMPGFCYKVIDLETEELLGPYQRGELCLKTDFQMNGYFSLNLADAWDADGWIKTGDIVYYDEDHCFYVVDRVKDMLKYQSWHVSPAVLEGILLTHPKVEAAIVVGLPHPEDGDHPMAVVKLKDFENNVSAKELEEYTAVRVDERQKLRGGVRILNNIPVTPTGKIKRKDIRDMILQGTI